ncbi:hypothetical protein ACFL9U_04065 [Thermodesulfobacteriota bacterium]
MATKTFEITEYKYGFFNGATYHKKRMVAHLYQNDACIAVAHFHEAPQAPYTDDHDLIRLFYPMEDFLSFIDMLRNEGPIFLHYDERPQGTQAFLTTSKELIGEGEMKD